MGVGVRRQDLRDRSAIAEDVAGQVGRLGVEATTSTPRRLSVAPAAAEVATGEDHGSDKESENRSHQANISEQARVSG